jgi:hypothetical protein
MYRALWQKARIFCRRRPLFFHRLSLQSQGKYERLAGPIQQLCRAQPLLRKSFPAGPRRCGRRQSQHGLLAEVAEGCGNQQSHLQNNLIAQTLRYAQNFILGISNICLW